MKRLSYLSLLLSLFALVNPTNAQSPWYAYFFNNRTAELVYVTEDGQTQSFSLGLGEPPMISQHDLSFANTRQELAYCTVESNNGQMPSQRATRLVIRDIPNERNSLELDLGLSDYCHAGIYNSNDTLLTVGILRHFGDAEAANPLDPQWEILLIDIASASIVDSINSSKPGAEIVIPYEDGEPNSFFVPDVFAIEDGQLFFSATATHGASLAYSYNFNNQEFAPSGSWHSSVEYYGRESVSISFLEEYPHAYFIGAYDPNNAVIYTDSTGAERIIYYSDEWIVADATFINGGAQIAISLYEMVNNTAKWIVLDRDGQESDLLSQPSHDGNIWYSTQVQPAFEGYSLIESQHNGDTGESVYKFSLVQNGSSRLLWEQAAERDVNWTLVHLAAMPYQEFPAFPEFDLSGVSASQ